jgi:hypothetical protein
MLEPAERNRPWRAERLSAIGLPAGAIVDAREPTAKLRDIERFFHDAGDLELAVFVLVNRGRVGRQDNDIALEAPLAEPMHEIEPGDADHHMIRDDEIEGGLGLLKKRQRLVAVSGKGGVVTGELQDGGQGRSRTGLVIDDEDIESGDKGCLHRIDPIERASRVPSAPQLLIQSSPKTAAAELRYSQERISSDPA